MDDFLYAAPRSLSEAVALLAKAGGTGRVMAGGTDLIVQLREGLRRASIVVDVKKIPELMQLEVNAEGGLRLGAGVACSKVHNNRQVAAEYAGLTDATHIIGAWQIQSRASVGGNLCNGSPAADSSPILIAYAAKCRIAGKNGERTLPVEQFFAGPGKTILAPDEILVSIDLPPQKEKSSARYLRFIPRNEMDIAVVGVGAWVQLDKRGETIESARIGLGAVAPTPLLATEASQFLAGKAATEETYKAAGEVARRAAKPISDMRGPAEYRTHLVGVLTQRALAGAVQRARGQALTNGQA